MTIPDKAEKAMARAREHYLQGHFESAQRDIHQALSVCQHCGLAFTFQGVLDLQLGKKKDAAHAFERAIEEDPNPGSAYLGLGIIFNGESRYTEAIVAFDSASRFLPDSWLLHFESALAHLSAGQTAAGLKEIACAGQLTGTIPEKLSALAYLRGIAQVELRDYGAAKDYFNQAAILDPMGNYAVLAKKRIEELTPSISMIP